MPGRSEAPSFDELYRKYADRVYGYCYRLCGGSAADAEDLAQDALVMAYRNLHQFEGRSAVLTWLYQITLRAYLQRKQLPPTVLLEDEEGFGGPDPTPGHVDRIWVRDALASLPEGLRAALVLVKMEGLTHREAADVLGIPVGTVQFRVHDALTRLRKRWKEDERVPYLGALMPPFVLELGLRQWGRIKAPPTLASRVYSEIGRAPGEVSPADSPRPFERVLKQAGEGVLRYWPAGLALLLTAVVGTAAWRTQAPPAPPSELIDALDALSHVATAQARGTYTSYRTAPDGTPVTSTTDVEFAYKMPGKYRMLRGSRQRTGGLVPMLIITSGGRTARWLKGPPVRRVPLPSEAAYSELAPFAIFTEDGLLPRLVRGGSARTRVLRAESGSQDTLIFEVEARSGSGVHRWTLETGVASRKVVRLDYRREGMVGGQRRPALVVSLPSGWRLDEGLSDALFQADEPPTRSQ